MSVLVEVSWGELIDKVTVLDIKAEHIQDHAKLKNVHAEREALAEAWSRAHASTPALAGLEARLKGVNARLWDSEDWVRDCERAKDFGQRFVELARSVYVTNDERAALKREINLLLGSELVEEKSYQPYD